MWELSISVNNKNSDIAKYIFQTLKRDTVEYDCVVTCYKEYDNIYILIACGVLDKNRVCLIVERCIIGAVCKYFKNDFLNQNLRLPLHEKMSVLAFKKALISFDKETDFYLIDKYLDLKQNFHLESFYYFKLKVLREKWGELINLANDNCDYLSSNDAFFDLLKFLIDNLEICEKEIDVFENGNGYFIKDDETENSISKENISKENMVSSLIELSPKKINFFCENDYNTAGFLSKIFEERINVCYNKPLEMENNLSFIKN